jgi:predicted AAA+ superfamily ATPase
MDEDTAASAAFNELRPPEDLLTLLVTADNRGPIDPDRTLIILDEVQEKPKALTALKYFAEQAPQYHIATAGSLLGVALHAGTSFPVGKVQMRTLLPLTFAEFLAATGRQGLADLVAGGEPDLLTAAHDELVEQLRWYYIIGGMPAAASAFAERRDTREVRALQAEILNDYEQDFSKHAPLPQVPRLREVWRSVPGQLAKENRKFVYGHVRKGARAAAYELALLWLGDTGLVRRVPRVTAPRLPLRAYADASAFKVFCHDVGLLGALAGLDPAVLLRGDALFTEFKGALAEQYVCQELVAAGLEPFYWSNDAGRAEVDFVVETGGRIVPVEVKAHTNLQAKSLRVYRDKYRPDQAVRLSLAPYESQPGLLNLPLYAASRLASG